VVWTSGETIWARDQIIAHDLAFAQSEAIDSPPSYPDDTIFQIGPNTRRMNARFDVQTIALTLAWVGTACWVVCFWWMHRLSSRQETMLQELHDVTKRIEKLSKDEHEILQELHPNVEEIKESVKDVAVAVSAEDSSGKAVRR
jgi:hypothetical protein